MDDLTHNGLAAPGSAEVRGLELVDWKPLHRDGSLHGFGTFLIKACGLIVIDCPVLVSHGRPWIALPGKPQIRDGRVVVDAKCKAQYTPTLKWVSRAFSDKFSQVGIDLILKLDPNALDPERASDEEVVP